MKNILIAILISVAIHVILLVNFKHTQVKDYTPDAKKGKENQYTFVKLASLKQPPKPKPIQKPKIQQKAQKKIEKKVTKKTIKKKIKQPPKPKAKKLITNLDNIPITNFKQVMEQAREIQEIKQLDPLTQSYIQLYGEEYFKYSKAQRQFLKKNINVIGRITQQYLIYPNIAIRTHQSGLNVVEFTLKKNGDITEPHIINGSSYEVLDKNTIKTIQLAYKDYPHPSEDVKIIIYVQYILN